MQCSRAYVRVIQSLCVCMGVRARCGCAHCAALVCEEVKRVPIFTSSLARKDDEREYEEEDVQDVPGPGPSKK